MVAVGKPEPGRRAARVSRTKQRLLRVESTPFGFETKGLLIGAAGMPIFAFAAENEGYTQGEIGEIRSATINSLWREKRCLKNRVMTMTLLVRGHLVDAAQVPLYQIFMVIRQLLKKRADLRLVFEKVWDARGRAVARQAEEKEDEEADEDTGVPSSCRGGGG